MAAETPEAPRRPNRNRSRKGDMMAEMTRRNFVAGAMAAGAAMGMASIAHADEAASGETDENLHGFSGVDVDQSAYDEVEQGFFFEGLDKTTPGIKHAPDYDPSAGRNIVIFNASNTVDGNGDTLAQAVVDEIGDAATVTRFDLRNCNINYVTQHGDVPPVEDVSTTAGDSMTQIIPAIHDATGLVFIFPTTYNTIDPRTLTMISRLWQPTWSNPDWELGMQKRVAVIGTCTGSTKEWLTLNVKALLDLPDVMQSVADSRVEIINGCGSPDVCANTPENLDLARDVADWVIE